MSASRKVLLGTYFFPTFLAFVTAWTVRKSLPNSPQAFGMGAASALTAWYAALALKEQLLPKPISKTQRLVTWVVLPGVWLVWVVAINTHPNTILPDCAAALYLGYIGFIQYRRPAKLPAPAASKKGSMTNHPYRSDDSGPYLNDGNTD